MGYRINPNNRTHMQRLQNAIYQSRRKMEPFRRNRYAALREYVGRWYSDDGTPDRVPINLIDLAVTILSRALAPGTPQILATSKRKYLRPAAKNLEAAMNKRLIDMKFGETISDCVMDGLFSLAVCKVGVKEIDSFMAEDGIATPVGESYALPVHLDDWVHDMVARRYEEVQFSGNRFRLPLSFVKDSDLYFKDVREKLQPTHRDLYNEQGDIRAETLSQGFGASGLGATGDDAFRDYIELWEVWLPMERLIVTLPSLTGSLYGSGEEPLRIVEWEGPDHGPYHLLGYQKVPGNLMPKAPVMNYRDLHDTENRLYRKLIRQAERQKTVTAAQGSSLDDSERVRDADDGDIILVNAPQNIKEMRFGGVDNINLAFAIQVIDQFSMMAGNIEAIGGLGPQADTLGQDQIIQNSASEQIEFMADRTTTFTKAITEDLAWYEWNEPYHDRSAEKTIPGTEIKIPAPFAPQDRHGRFSDYDISLAPYSLQDTSPSQRLNTIGRIFGTFIQPNMQALMANGVQVNWPKFLRRIAKYANVQADMDDILMMAGEPGGEGGGDPMRQSPNTTRTNVRVNRPGATSPGKRQILMQHLLGGGLQSGERESIGRAVG